jgi:hypothetical protein
LHGELLELSGGAVLGSLRGDRHRESRRSLAVALVGEDLSDRGGDLLWRGALPDAHARSGGGTRVAFSGWSRPIGITTIGTPAASAFITVPWPPWVTTAAACGSTAACGAASTTLTLPPAVNGGTAGPVVTSPRTGSVPSAAAVRRSASPWSWYVELRPTSTSGASPGGSESSPAQSGSSSRGPTMRTFG